MIIKEEDRLIGNCGIRKKTSNLWEADIGYEIATSFCGKGLATEAALALLKFGFDELGLHRISANCIADNLASARVLAKIGMQCEGRLRQNEWMKGRWWDTLVYGILADEWEIREGEA